MDSFIEGANTYDSWYVVCSKPRMERYAAQALKDSLGLAVFLPQRKIVEARNEIKYVPFFPGYLFIQADPKTFRPDSVNTCPGVRALMRFHGELEAVPHTIIELLHRKVNDFNRAEGGGKCEFHPSDPVRIKEGPLQELNMVFLGYNTSEWRARTLIRILGRLKEVQVHTPLLEKVPGEPRRKDVRFTRGKGRKIRNNG